jgi:flagellar hook-basal body complex protein FliE
MADPISSLTSALSSINIDTGARPVPVIQDRNANSVGFQQTLTRFVNAVSDQQDVATDYISRFTRGEPVELHQVMSAAEEASISLEMLIEVRNKFLDAYRTVINMQS